MSKFTTGVSSSVFLVDTVIADDKKGENWRSLYTSEKFTYHPNPSKTSYNVLPSSNDNIL